MYMYTNVAFGTGGSVLFIEVSIIQRCPETICEAYNLHRSGKEACTQMQVVGLNPT